MSSVIIIDTSIFLNVLDVPGMNQDKEKVFSDLTSFIDKDASLLLPMAAVYETGNHIAQLPNGGNRRQIAFRFAKQVSEAISGQAPWQAMAAPSIEQVSQWLSEFPDSAMRGAGMGDLSIIKEWELACARTPRRRVFIWALDDDLKGYDHQP